MNRRDSADRISSPHLLAAPRYQSLLGSGQIEVSWGDPPRPQREHNAAAAPDSARAARRFK